MICRFGRDVTEVKTFSEEAFRGDQSKTISLLLIDNSIRDQTHNPPPQMLFYKINAIL